VIPTGLLAEVVGREPLDDSELGRRLRAHLRDSEGATTESDAPHRLPPEFFEKVTPSPQLAAISAAVHRLAPTS
jgi:hypothetical protein